MKKDCFYAQTAILLSLGFWIPLFNIGFAITSLFVALKSIRLADLEPKKYGGRKRAIAAIVLSISTIILTIVGVGIYAGQVLRTS